MSEDWRQIDESRRRFLKQLNERYSWTARGRYELAIRSGWYHIIDKLAADLTPHAERNPELRITQIKEKFGTLRVYLSHSNDQIKTLVQAAESESVIKCEDCGLEGKLRAGNWLKTLCDFHAKGRPAFQWPSFEEDTQASGTTPPEVPPK